MAARPARAFRQLLGVQRSFKWGSPRSIQSIQRNLPGFVPDEVGMSGPERYGNRVLNNTEKRVVELVAQGLKNNEVAEAMGTTRYVVVNYLRVIYDKLGVWNRVELALWYESRKHQGEMN